MNIQCPLKEADAEIVLKGARRTHGLKDAKVIGQKGPMSGHVEDKQNPLVVLVEDESSVAEVLQMSLHLENISVLRCSNGKEALALISRRKFPDLVITDMMMPIMGGVELIESLRNIPHWNVPILAISAMPAYLDEAKKLGATAILKKPMSLDAFLGLVHQLLEFPRVQLQRFPDVPVNRVTEQKRLEAIKRLGVDRYIGKTLETYTEKVARFFRVPICLVSIITDVAQYWTAGFGIPTRYEPTRGGPKGDAFCTLPVESHASLIVQNAVENPLFFQNPFVTQAGVRFYAGVPITDFLGHVLGTFCLLDYKPKIFTALDLELLTVFSRRVVSDIDSRAIHAYPGLPKTCLRHIEYYDEELEIPGRQAFLELASVMTRLFSTRAEPMGLLVLATEKMSLKTVIEGLRHKYPSIWFGRLGFARLAALVPGKHSIEAKAEMESILGKDVAIIFGEVERSPGSVVVDLADLEDKLGDFGLLMPKRDLTLRTG